MNPKSTIQNPKFQSIELIRSLFEWVYGVFPKRNCAVIYGWPDHEDNVIALEQALQDAGVDRVVLLVSDPSSQPFWKTGDKTCWVKKNSLRGLGWFFTARYVFFTHPCFARRFPRDVVSVNIWHGMPVKRIGWMLEGNEGIESRYALATSPFWADIMDRAMRPRESALVVGLPRNDRLFGDRAEVRQKLEMGEGQRMVAWLPTYRKSVRGELRVDGTEYGNVFAMPDIDPRAVNEWLAQRELVAWVKPHPMAQFEQGEPWSHLKVVDSEWLHARGVSLYALLGASDALVSDISSVVIDYLLLDRPVIHAFPDRVAYGRSRGFSVEPIKDYFAGEVVSTMEEWMAALDDFAAGRDPHAEKRRALRDLSHTHQDNKAAERLLEAVGL